MDKDLDRYLFNIDRSLTLIGILLLVIEVTLLIAIAIIAGKL